MARKQVQLDLATPALSPTNARGGQYSVAVPATPKTNAALQLSRALRVAPQILGQASNIAKQAGADKAAQVTDVEAALQDDGVKGILGYDKAYQQGLVKRHFVQNESTIRERFMNLSRTEDSLKMTPDEFLQSMDAERQTFVEELMEDFGGNPQREQAINALTSTFVDQLRDEATGEFVKNKKDQAIMMVSADAQDLFDKEGAKAGLDYMRTELSAMGIDMTPSERAQKMRDGVVSNVSVLIQEGRFTDAEKLLDDAAAYGIQGAGPLFGSTKGKDDLRRVKNALNTAIEKAEESFSDNSKGVGRSVDALMQDIADPNTAPEDVVAAAMRMATRAGVTPEAAQEFSEKVSGGSIDDFISAYRDLARDATNETTRDLLNDQLGEINRAKKEYFGGSASTIGTFSDDDMGTLETSIREVLDRNPKAARHELPISVNGRKVNYQDPDYINMVNRVMDDYQWARTPTQKDSIIREAQKAIRKDIEGFGLEYATRVSSELNDEAPSMWRKAKGDVALYEDLLVERAGELQGEYKRRADLRSTTDSLLDIDLKPADEAKAIKEGSKNRKVRDLPSFQFGQPVTATDVVTDRKALKDLDVSDADRRRLVQASLLSYGFPTTDSIDLKLLNDADMGFADVLLGDAVLRDMVPALRGYQAGDNATPDQKKAIKKWEEYGFDSLEDFNRLEEVQTTLRNLQNR